jgi:hypothetical protein
MTNQDKTSDPPPQKRPCKYAAASAAGGGLGKPAGPWRWLMGAAWLGAAMTGGAAEYLTPNDVVLPSEMASEEALAQSAGRASLRFLGLDLFPHASIGGMYDDNVLIAHTNAIGDFEWTLSPGLTVAAGDVSTAFPGAVTLAQLRDLLSYSLVDDDAKPQRFIGLDFTPSINLFTRHGSFNNVDYQAGLTAGYAFSRLSMILDQSYTRLAVKDNEVGARVTRILYETKLRTRYDLNERTAFELNERFRVIDYDREVYHGYQEFRSEAWADRRVGGKLDLGLGAALGFVYPSANPNQTYQQFLGRAIYRISGKLDVRTSVGGELREYDSGIENTLDPVFDLALIYQFRPMTTLTLEAHRRDVPSPQGYYNYQTLGVSAGARQRMFGRWSASLILGYDQIDYLQLGSSATTGRTDNYYSVRAGLDYEMDRHLTAGLFYVFQKDASTVDQFAYRNNLVGFNVAWKY